jgi:type IV pilus assembly protein PilZ
VVEKRQHPRRTAAVDVVVHAPAGAVSARSRDLSLGGMFVFTDVAFVFGSKVSIEIVLPTLGATKLSATVRWTTPEGVGVQFDPMGVRETHALADLVS